MEGEGRAWGSCAGAHRGVLSFGHFFGREGLLDESLWSRDPHLLEKRGITLHAVSYNTGLRGEVALRTNRNAFRTAFTLNSPGGEDRLFRRRAAKGNLVRGTSPPRLPVLVWFSHTSPRSSR